MDVTSPIKKGRLPRHLARRTALVFFGLLFIYLHGLYLSGFLATEQEYFYDEVGPPLYVQYLCLAFGITCNFGAIASAFWPSPKGMAKGLMVFSLASGVLVSTSWLIDDFIHMGFSGIYGVFWRMFLVENWVDVVSIIIEFILAALYPLAIFIYTYKFYKLLIAKY